MPIYEFICPKHGKFEKLMPSGARVALCEVLLKPSKDPKDGDLSVFSDIKCGETCERVEFSVPAKRNPRYGEG